MQPGETTDRDRFQPSPVYRIQPTMHPADKSDASVSTRTEGIFEALETESKERWTDDCRLDWGIAAETPSLHHDTVEIFKRSMIFVV